MTYNFKPAKLSQEALDAFVKKYSTTKFGDSIPYTTKSRRNTCFFFCSYGTNSVFKS